MRPNTSTGPVRLARMLTIGALLVAGATACRLRQPRRSCRPAPIPDDYRTRHPIVIAEGGTRHRRADRLQRPASDDGRTRRHPRLCGYSYEQFRQPARCRSWCPRGSANAHAASGVAQGNPWLCWSSAGIPAVRLVRGELSRQTAMATPHRSGSAMRRLRQRPHPAATGRRISSPIRSKTRTITISVAPSQTESGRAGLPTRRTCSVRVSHVADRCRAARPGDHVTIAVSEPGQKRRHRSSPSTDTPRSVMNSTMSTDRLQDRDWHPRERPDGLADAVRMSDRGARCGRLPRISDARLLRNGTRCSG